MGKKGGGKVKMERGNEGTDRKWKDRGGRDDGGRRRKR